MTAPLSCYIRTLNERRMIADVVRAALAVCAEVVVVDSGSTDGTQQLARDAGARVIDQPWLGNGGQKRAGEDACRNDWLLDLDADEIVSPELAAQIAALFADGEPAHPVHELRLVTQPPYGPRWDRAAVAWRAKLYDRRRLRMPDHKAWDQLDLGGLRPVRLSAPLIHHSFTGIAQHLDKLNRVSTVRARETRLKSRPMLAVRIALGLPFYFLRHYLLRGLWRGGLYGFCIAVSSAMGRWLKDVKMLERHMAADAAPAAATAKAAPEAATTRAATAEGDASGGPQAVAATPGGAPDGPAAAGSAKGGGATPRSTTTGGATGGSATGGSATPRSATGGSATGGPEAVQGGATAEGATTGPATDGATAGAATARSVTTGDATSGPAPGAAATPAAAPRAAAGGRPDATAPAAGAAAAPNPAPR
jgi:hypothetical protein